ncbi:MAG: protein kinase [Myxococcota bacterium]
MSGPADESDRLGTLQSTPHPARESHLIPEPGDVLANAYVVRNLVGRGGMGVVLRAFDRNLEREVALKLIDPEYAQSPSARARFVAEARAMAGVRHENIVQIYSFGDFQSLPFFVMELIEGTSAADWLDGFAPERPSPLDDVLAIIDQVCRGVSAVHRAGIIHGDLKPGNILIGPAFRIAVADFGLMRILSQQSDKDDLVGTPAYIAPELALAKGGANHLGPLSDVYSLGVTSYELLTGTVPFDIDSAAELISVHSARYPFPSPRDLRDDIPEPVSSVVMQALAPEPRARIESVDFYRRALIDARSKASLCTQFCIVLADDDENFRALAEETLRFALPEASIISVEDGTEALHAVDRAAPDLVVLDLDMPGLNGIELTAALRAGASAKQDLSIVVVTAFGGGSDWRLLSNLGADGFLVKPIDPYALIALARRLAGRAESMRPQRLSS